ncbi:diaminopimelate decarboxylase [Endothiovibrio diazotrophicus]
MSGEWWSRDDLHYRDGRLLLAGRNLGELAARLRGPVFFYSAERVLANLRRLANALAGTGLDARIHYAMKANRFMPLLARMKASGLCGIDACSPGEVEWALQCGFEAGDISYTNTSVSNDDLDTLVRHPEMWINLDSLSSIRRYGERAPGRAIGLRINPALGVGYGDNELLRYSTPGATTKFGIYREQFEEALETAARYGLQVKGIHFHTGCGYLSSQLPLWGEILERCRDFLDRLDRPQLVNLGGGLGVPHQAGDEPLDLARWSGEIRRVFGDRGVRVLVEPGDYVVKDAGVLVLQANTVEDKRDTLFVGVDGGFNLAIEPAFYHLPCAPLPCLARPGEPVVATIAGNINEALDLWARNVRLTPVEEGDRIAFINAGGYASAMSSNHCVRGRFSEFLLG